MAEKEWSPIAKVYDPLKCGSIDGTDDYPHDKAIIRAMTARYKPNSKVVGDPLCTIFVAKLNPDTNENTLSEIFSEYGSIKNIRLVRHIVTEVSRRYAFIEYESRSAAKVASINANKSIIDGREIFVDMELERVLPGWIPRRLGGGFGGKKESGQLRFGGKDRPFRKPIILSQPHGESHEHHQQSYQQPRHTRSYRGASYHHSSVEQSERRASDRQGYTDSSGKSNRYYSADRYERKRSRERRLSRDHRRSRERRSRSTDRKRSRSCSKEKDRKRRRSDYYDNSQR